MTASDFHIPADPRFVLNSFGVICFGLVGLELASIMGDEIRDPQRTLPGAVAWGGVLSGALYIGATLTLLVSIPKERHQRAAGHRAGGQPHGGKSRRWLDHRAVRDHAQPFDRGHRIGLDGRLGPYSVCCRSRFLYAVVAGQSASAIRDAVRRTDRAGRGFAHPGGDQLHASGGVQEAFQTMLSLAVVLQLCRSSTCSLRSEVCVASKPRKAGRYSRGTLLFAGMSGLGDHHSWHRAGVFPVKQITSLWKYEAKMFGSHWRSSLLAVFFFFVYGRLKREPYRPSRLAVARRGPLASRRCQAGNSLRQPCRS